MNTVSADRPTVLFKRNGICPFIFAIAIVGGATVARLPFKVALGDASPFLFYWPSVFVVAVLFGLRPGLLATAAALVLANYFWMPPLRSWGLNEVEFLQLLTFGFASSSLAWLSEWVHLERQSKERFQATLANAGEAIVTTDCAGKIQFLNAAAQFLLGLSSDEAIGQPITTALSLVPVPGRRPTPEILGRALLEDGPEPLPDPLVLVSKGGRQYAVKAIVSRMLNKKRQKTGTVIVFHTAEQHQPHL